MKLELKTTKPLRKYEGVAIVHPDVSEEDQKQLFRKTREILKTFNGAFHTVESWGKRRLANPIEKIKIGAYFHYFFEAYPEAIEEVERTMRINEHVMRFLHVRLDDRVTIGKHADSYKQTLKASVEREVEREAKFQAKKAAMAAAKKNFQRPPMRDNPK